MIAILLTMVLAAPAFEPVHFVSNSDQISESEFAPLDHNTALLQNNRDAVVILEGHCDEWGEASYNMELGDRRAREVKAYLMEKGVDPERIIMVVSYGESRPADERHIMDAWRKNRRVEFVLR
ncbi:MAG: OmpA family protein [Deltaproteobacteria bacterium]|nr:OmpA family protein [Deltaproteobacteria bacterium]MDZ4224426.1 OmpA family protein [bacterium]